MGEGDHKPQVYQAENVVDKPKRRGCVGHCVKFWWAYLIGLIVIVVIVVPVIIFVGIPKIAQDKLNHAKLTVEGIVMTDPKPNQYTMEIISHIESSGGVKANIDPFEGIMFVTEYGPEKAFAKLNFPATTAEKHQTVVVKQTNTIGDMMENWKNFNIKLLQSKEFEVSVEGKTKVQAKGVSKKFDVDFKKTLIMPGLNHLDGTEVFNTTIDLEAEYNFVGKARIPNHSHVTFELGNATFHNYLLGKEVGTVFIDNIKLVPGEENIHDMKVKMKDLFAVLDAVNSDEYCKDGIVPFQISGQDVQYNGEQLPYFLAALSAGNQTLNIDLKTPLAKAGVTVKCGGGGH